MNLECPSWNANAMAPNAHFLQDVKGKLPGNNLPGLTYWWQSDLASYVDFTRQSAVDWWTVRRRYYRVARLQRTVYGQIQKILWPVYGQI